MSNVLAVKSGGSYIELPQPAYTTYKSVWQEGNIAARNTSYDMIKKRIAVKYTIDCEWHYISAAKKNLIISNTDGNSFELRFLSMMDDTVKYSEFYRGNDLEITGYGKLTGNTFQYYNVKASFIEM